MSQMVLDPVVTAPAKPASMDDMADRLRGLVRHNSRRWKTVIALEAVGIGISAPLAYLWFIFFLDNQFHLPVPGRLLASGGFLVGLGWIGALLWRRWEALHLTEDQVALAMEQRTLAKVNNRLINAVQLARGSRNNVSALREAVVQENYEGLQQIHLEQAAQLQPALLRLGLAAALILFGVGFWLILPDEFGNAAARIFRPLADIKPLYRTTLTFDPDDETETIGDLKLTVTIEGERPDKLTIFRRVQSRQTTENVTVPSEGPVVHTFRDVTQGFDYAVRGGDYMSRYFHVTVPTRAALARVRVTYQYPAYTQLPTKTVEGVGGDLEALQGTKAQLTFVFDQPVDRATLVLDQPGSAKNRIEPQELARQGDGKQFAGAIDFDSVLAYRLEMNLAKQPVQRTPSFSLRVLKDQEPKLELLGLDRRTDILPDSVVPLQIVASDDFGLEKVGLFYRRSAPTKAAPAADDGWLSLAQWSGDKKTALKLNHELAVAGLSLAEGEKVELALRAADTDPLKNGAWVTGAIYELAVGGDGVGLQIQYEQILRSEAELKELIRSEQELNGKVIDWLKKLDGSGNLRWDDPKNVELLHAAVKELGKEQDKIRATASKVARGMLVQAGNVRISVGMLADTEMVRVTRILDSVLTRDQPPAKRAALADGRLTQDRIVRSLLDLGEQYASFRSDWELGNMIPFTKMLAERQTKMRDLSRQQATQKTSPTEALQRQSMSRRQDKVLALCQLIQPAFVGLGERLKEQEPILSKAYQAGAVTLAGESLQSPMKQAAPAAKDGNWTEAARLQTLAADALTTLHAQLRQAQVEAAQRALALLKEKAKSNVEAQKEIEKLKPGTSDIFVKDYPDGFKVEDLMRFWEITAAKKVVGKEEEPDLSKVNLLDVNRKQIELEKDSGVYQDPYTLKLGKTPEKTPVLPHLYKDKENKVKPFIQEKFDDLVGKLLDEADELNKDYQSINLSTNQNNNDPGEISKVGGALNSTGAVTATGNKKPPTTESGGVSRTGRQGARAYGMIADDDAFNRKGRDQALEGKQEVGDQPGLQKMNNTDENQKDTSTGVGGKKIQSDDTHFSLHDAGKWKDEYTKRMDAPQKKTYIVERQGDKIDAKTAMMLKDLTSKQEQVIERLKAIKKELKNLYLPTEHLDELAAALEANLEMLKDRPEAELFRLQEQTLDKLRGSMRVFAAANGSFQPSLPRDRMIRGRVLDEPGRAALPGYEEATKQYYLRLATQ